MVAQGGERLLGLGVQVAQQAPEVALARAGHLRLGPAVGVCRRCRSPWQTLLQCATMRPCKFMGRKELCSPVHEAEE